MKAIIVYYSLEGNTKYVAEKVAKTLGADILALEPKKKYPTGKISKFMWGGKSAVMAEKPELESYTVDLSAYDTVIFGTPVWASTFTPPLRTFISKENLSGKKIGLYACSAGGKTEKCIQKLETELGIDHAYATLSLIDPLKLREQAKDEEIEKFCRKFM